ncbi:MAG: hypothetical protein ACYC46_04395 [Acidobacteriaceae bacterium]
MDRSGEKDKDNRSRRFPIYTIGGAKRIQAILISVSVFCFVFILAAKYRYTQDTLQPKPHAVLGYSYALHDTSLYPNKYFRGPTIQRIPQNTVVEIVGFQIKGLPSDWMEIHVSQSYGYVFPFTFAPPKITNEDSGYVLLKDYMKAMPDPSVITLASNAVRFYSELFSTSPHREELLWVLGERLAAFAKKKDARSDIRSREYDIYVQLSQQAGPYQRLAMERLKQWKRSSIGAPHLSLSGDE